MYSNPMVPDVSLLFEKPANSSTRPQQRPDAHLSYDAWKSTQISHRNTETTTRSPSNITNSTNDPSTQVSNSILRKQVRFRGPNLPQNIKNAVVGNTSECNENFGPFTNGRTDNKISDFEKIYLANIPNRKLDLSIIEPPVPKGTREGNCSKFSQLEKKVDAPVYDIFNYKSDRTKEFDSNYYVDYHCAQTACEIKSELGSYLTKSTYATEPPVNVPFRPIFDNKEMPMYRHYSNEQIPQLSTETNATRESSAALIPSHNADQPTVRDLLEIIRQQNDQLLILQKQVATLIDNQQTHRKTIENRQTLAHESTPQVFDKDQFGPMNKNHILPNKFNIDVMTSFEVSIRPQQKPCGRPFDGCRPQEAKIHEISEQLHDNTRLNDVINPPIETGQAKGQANELSLMLNEPLQVQEGRMSPEQSVHVDMHDYSSDSDCNSDDSPDLGWTIYNNVMGQVNNILTKANVARMNQTGTKPTSNDQIKIRTMKNVKEATLRHLQTIGVHVPVDDPADSLRTCTSNEDLEYSPSEVSFAVQQLLMKYLPSEYLAKVTNVPEDIQPKGIVPNARKRNNNGPKVNLVPRRPEFSFATVQYMKKYNLLASLEEERIPVQHKFLDITALKRQPKLL